MPLLGMLESQMGTFHLFCFLSCSWLICLGKKAGGDPNDWAFASIYESDAFPGFITEPFSLKWWCIDGISFKFYSDFTHQKVSEMKNKWTGLYLFTVVNALSWAEIFHIWCFLWIFHNFNFEWGQLCATQNQRFQWVL